MRPGFWIAADRSDEPVGFLVAEAADDSLFVKEVSVVASTSKRPASAVWLMQAAEDRARWVAFAR